MIERALAADVPFTWVTADEAHGDNGPLRFWLEATEVSYVLAVARDHRVCTDPGLVRAEQIAARLPRRAGQQTSAGNGAKGHRYYDWAWIGVNDETPGYRWLLIRRNPRTGELAFYHCYSPHPVPLSTLVEVAGSRSTIEENFQAGKGLTGLDEHQVHRWASWYRWVTLAMLAGAVLTIAAASETTADTEPDKLIPLTRNEIAHLLTNLTTPTRGPDHWIRWSHWRRRHQHHARQCHYQRQRTRDHDLRLE
jgi:SRSO17 transposase